MGEDHTESRGKSARMSDDTSIETLEMSENLNVAPGPPAMSNVPDAKSGMSPLATSQASNEKSTVVAKVSDEWSKVQAAASRSD